MGAQIKPAPQLLASSGKPPVNVDRSMKPDMRLQALGMAWARAREHWQACAMKGGLHQHSQLWRRFSTRKQARTSS